MLGWSWAEALRADAVQREPRSDIDWLPRNLPRERHFEALTRKGNAAPMQDKLDELISSARRSRFVPDLRGKRGTDSMLHLLRRR